MQRHLIAEGGVCSLRQFRIGEAVRSWTGHHRPSNSRYPRLQRIVAVGRNERKPGQGEAASLPSCQLCESLDDSKSTTFSRYGILLHCI